MSDQHKETSMSDVIDFPDRRSRAKRLQER